MSMNVFNKWIIALASVLFLNVAQGQSTNTFCPLTTKSIAIDAGSISYLQGGQGPSVLLLHGLFGQKEQWTDMACALAKQGFHVIAPDLPGYGQSSAYPITIYQLESQVKTLQRFMRSVSGNSFHIAGNSMGGAIAGLYANQYAQEIKSLAFIGAPLGIIPWSNQVRDSIYQGVNPFIPVDQAQLDLEMDLLFAKPPVISDDIKTQLLQEYRNNNRHYQQVWDIVNFYGDTLKRFPNQSLPTFILWGEHDEIFNISGLPILKKKFPHSQSHRLANVGHLVMLEQPVKIADLYTSFLKKSQ
ncbi:alpha/beta fold hydrolase [Polynucleobacter sp. es-EL-1]|uniref:alpha/beta fold hydrolase n=1 Tax=Polynucleobacter sp. es-EL-1 TaxID=1855652 RepID=UPI001BFD62DD|nr:alpha/beta hydrolase [Polynucleobacter sp. es-EL-1]QWE10959.1 alpha/beta hydrolase [Polynucleobacter sp. es-EL-1]